MLVPTEELNRFRLEEVATGKLDTDVRLVGNWISWAEIGPATGNILYASQTEHGYDMPLKGLLTGNDTVLHHFDAPPTIARAICNCPQTTSCLPTPCVPARATLKPACSTPTASMSSNSRPKIRYRTGSPARSCQRTAK